MSVLLLLALLVSPTAQTSTKTPGRTIIITASDQMKYSVNEIDAKRGEVIRVRLVAIGTAPKGAMQHNFVLLKAGTNQLAFNDAAAKAGTTDYIPPALTTQILARTPLIGNGESAEIVITVPKTAGNYPYMCTFPGHFAAGMRGKLVVK